MENNAKNDVIEKVNELIEAPSCCPEAKAAAQSWLDSIGTDEEMEALCRACEEILNGR